LSAFRELFSFVGILLAAVLPAIMRPFYQNEIISFRFYGAIFAALIIIVSAFLISSPNNASTMHQHHHTFNFKKIATVCAYKPMRFILMLFFINSLPVAITSNLFNFYVDDILKMQGQAAILLLTYFGAAAFGAISSGFFLSQQSN
jgi:Na+/melibiose symporter-like transporter